MGFLGGDNEPSQASELIDEQIRQNRAELEAKKENLYRTRLDIIKSQGSPNYGKSDLAGDRGKGAGGRGGGFGFGGTGFLMS